MGFCRCGGDASDSVPVRVTWKFAGAIAQSCDDVFAEQWDKAYFPDFGCAYDLPGGVMNDDPFPAQDPDTEKWGYIDKSANGLSSPNTSKRACSAMGLAWCTLKTRVQVS